MDYTERKSIEAIREGMLLVLVQLSGNPYVRAGEVTDKTHEVLNLQSKKVFDQLKEKGFIK